MPAVARRTVVRGTLVNVHPLIWRTKSRPQHHAHTTGNSCKGVLVFKRPWPSVARTIFNDHQRYLTTYTRQYAGYYLTGDGCERDSDGYHWITGRIDDVINVSGHRLGTAELESALVHSPACAEAACVGVPHEIKG